MEILLQTLGPPRCYANGALTDLATQKLRFALLVYLASERTAARESVAALFWPESDEEHARRALAQTIYQLRLRLGDDWLEAEPDPLQITDAITIDVRQFETCVEQGDLGGALALYRGHFLEGFHVKGSNEFETWLDTRRRELKRTYHRCARRHIETLVAAAQTREAIRTAEQWIQLDPLDDEANHALIQLLVAAGERTAALTHFESYRKRIKKELDVEPLEQTLALVAGLHEVPAAPLTRARQTASPIDTTPLPNALSFWGELKQRRVPRMATWYIATVFLVLQAGTMLVEFFYVPRWALTATAGLAVIGFPLTLVLSWYFEITPDGRLQRDPRAGPFRNQWRVLVASFVLAASGVIAAFITPLVRSAVGGTTILCSDGTPAPCRREVPIEANRFVVLPLVHAHNSEPALIDGELCAQLLTESLSHWQDVNIVDGPRVKQELNALPAGLRHDLPIDTALAMARRLGAGKLITGELWQHGDSSRVNAYLYEVQTGRLLSRRTARFPVGSMLAEHTFRRIADEFVVEEGKIRIGPEAANSTRSLGALQALDSAHRMIDDWRLADASAYLRKALQRDPGYAHAHLDLAYVMLWQNDTSEVLRLHADQAVAAAGALPPHKQLLARGIAHLANRRYTQSCAAYRELIARDAMSFYAWFGLGECLGRDNSVVRDSTSPSGWSFVTSRQEAIAAHERALLLVPSFNRVFLNLGSSQLANLLFLTAGKVRTGAASSDTLTFGAWPELVADTLSLIPYRYDEWSLRPKPPTVAAVVQAHRDRWSRSVAEWARTFPDNPRALEAWAWTVEYSGRLLPEKKGATAALTLIRRAREHETDAHRALRLAVIEVRVLFKAQRFKEARRLASSILREHANPTPNEALLLAGPAGMLGRAHDMAQLLVIGADSTDADRPLSGEDVDIPPPVARATAALLAYASVGAPVDSLRVLTQRAHATLNSFVPPAMRTIVHQTGLDRAARMTFPLLGVDDAHLRPGRGMPFINAQAALARADTLGLRRALDDLKLRMQRQNPSDFAGDGMLTYVQLRLALRDSAEARSVLDRYLADLSNLPRHHFGQPYQPAAIVRLMALRAELAARQSDRMAARKWSRAVVDLWQDSDRELRPFMQRMRSLTRF